MTVRRLDEVRAGGFEPGPRIEDQDRDGIDAEVLFGGLAGSPLPSRDPAIARELHGVQPLARRLLLLRADAALRNRVRAVRRSARHARGGARRGIPRLARGAPHATAPRGLLGRRAVGAAVARTRVPRLAGALPCGRRRRAAARGGHRCVWSARIPQLDGGPEARDVARARNSGAERRPRAAPGPEGRLRRGPDRVGPVLEGVHRPRLREAPVAPEPPLRRAPVVLHRPAGLLHLHGGPPRRRRPACLRDQPDHVGQRLPALGDHLAPQPQDSRRDVRERPSRRDSSASSTTTASSCTGSADGHGRLRPRRPRRDRSSTGPALRGARGDVAVAATGSSRVGDGRRSRAGRRSTPTAWSSRPASSTPTPTWTRRCSGTTSARRRAGTASRPWSWATAASRSRRARPDERALVVRNLERAEDIAPEAMAEGIDLDVVDLRRVPRRGRRAAQGHQLRRLASATPRCAPGRWASAPSTDRRRRTTSRSWRRSCAARCAAGAAGFTTSRSPAHTHLRRPAGRVTARRSWDEVVALVDDRRAREQRRLPDGVGAPLRARPAADFVRPASPGSAIVERCARSCSACFAPDSMPQPSHRVHRRDGRGTVARCTAHALPRDRPAQSFQTRLGFDSLPEWQEVRGRPLDEQQVLLRDPEVRRTPRPRRAPRRLRRPPSVRRPADPSSRR